MLARRCVFAVAAFALSAGVLSVSAQADSGPAFATSDVAPNQALGEPRVVVDPRASGPKFFVIGPGSDSSGHTNTLMWWSTDGKSFSGPATTNQASGGNDSDLAIDAKHTVYAADLSGPSGDSSVPITVWSPKTHRFTRVGFAAPGRTGLDRQWIASPAARTIVAIARDTNSGNELTWRSTDGGAHFSKTPTTIDSNVNVAGPLVTGPVSHGGILPLYFTYLHNNGGSTGGVVGGTSDLRLAKSTDGGKHWSTSRIADGQSATLFPVVAVDSAGGVYAAWSGTDPVANNSDVIVFSASTNGGSTWSKPVAVSNDHVDALNDAPAAIFPWVTAGGPGRVDVTFVIENQPVINSPEGSDDGGPQSTWDLRLAQSLNANTKKPTWTSKVLKSAFHSGSICSLGTGCLGPQSLLGLGNLPTPMDRRDLDFFGAATDASGNLYVAYCADRSAFTGDPNDLLFANIDVKLARQSGGSALSAAARRR